MPRGQLKLVFILARFDFANYIYSLIYQFVARDDSKIFNAEIFAMYEDVLVKDTQRKPF